MILKEKIELNSKMSIPKVKWIANSNEFALARTIICNAIYFLQMKYSLNKWKKVKT
jgi:hypothetical protein